MVRLYGTTWAGHDKFGARRAQGRLAWTARGRPSAGGGSPGPADAARHVAHAAPVEDDHDLVVLGIPPVHGRDPAEVQAALGDDPPPAVDERAPRRGPHLLDLLLGPAAERDHVVVG